MENCLQNRALIYPLYCFESDHGCSVFSVRSGVDIPASKDGESRNQWWVSDPADFGGMGEAVIQCHGIQLRSEEAEETDEDHKIFLERVADEYYVQIEHEMSKQHYISFIAAVSTDRLQMVKLYPQGNPEARIQISGVKKIYFYCNRNGLYFIDPVKGIDDKETGYDDVEERRELEKAAKMLFG